MTVGVHHFVYIVSSVLTQSRAQSKHWINACHINVTEKESNEKEWGGMVQKAASPQLFGESSIYVPELEIILNFFTFYDFNRGKTSGHEDRIMVKIPALTFLWKLWSFWKWLEHLILKTLMKTMSVLQDGSVELKGRDKAWRNKGN